MSLKGDYGSKKEVECRARRGDCISCHFFLERRRKSETGMKPGWVKKKDYLKILSIFSGIQINEKTEQEIVPSY